MSVLPAVPSLDSLQVSSRERSSPRVLIVEDNRDTARVLRLLLPRDMHDVCFAYDGIEALDMAHWLRPDIVLFDLALPGMHGHDVARRLRSAGWARNARFIAITAWGHEQVRRDSLDAGMDAHLVKPVTAASLAAALRPGITA